MTRRRLALPLLALALSVPLMTSCEKDAGSATPQAALELAELRAEQEQSFASTQESDGELQAELAALLAAFDRTADARLASNPHRITLLHLACVYKKPELARCLLLDGADVNARQLVPAPDLVDVANNTAPLVPADTPLSWATLPHREGATAEELLPLIDLLVQNGADVNQPGPLNMPPLVTACLIPSPAGEAVVLRLLELGAHADTTVAPEGAELPATAFVAHNGWHKALAAMLDAGAPLATPARSALHAAAENPADPGTLDCARLLLERGAAVDALNAEGATPLYVLTHELACAPIGESVELDAVCDMIQLFLQHGADALRTCDADPELPASCPVDFILANPAAQAKLAERGVTLPERKLDLGAAEGEAWLADICRASLFGMTGEDVKPHVGRLTALLATPPHELTHSHLYADACGHAVKLLARADAAQAGETVARLPLWREVKAWQAGDPRTAAILRAVLDTRGLALPRALLLEHAERMEAAEVHEVAALLAELMERDQSEGAESAIDDLCASDKPALRAGALTARLRRHDLPAPRNAAVAEWMAEHGISSPTADTPVPVVNALLLTSLDAFWCGTMGKAEVDALLQAMKDIGAPQAAAFYAELAACLDKPGELDRLTAPGGRVEAVRYELEAATAEYIWQHRAAFEQAAASKNPND